MILCIALYLFPADTTPIYEACGVVSSEVSSDAIAACNRDDRCEWIVSPASENRLEFTILQ